MEYFVSYSIKGANGELNTANTAITTENEITSSDISELEKKLSRENKDNPIKIRFFNELEYN